MPKWAKIRGITRQGKESYLAWQEVSDLVEQKRKLVESDQKIALAGERSIAVSDHLAIISSIVETFLKYIDDPQQRRKIHGELERRLELIN